MIFSFWQEHPDEFLDSMCEQGFCPVVIAAHKRFALSMEEQAGMEWLSNERGCSPQSCNTRLSSLRKFIKYLSSRNPKYLYLLDEAARGI